MSSLISGESTKKHQILILPNGLECLLIHDPSSEIIDGAMAVKSGAFDDPDGALGLAHLTEHLLLRGSKQFPPPFSLSQLLAASGGFLNAYTTSDQTCFYFEVSTYAQNTIGRGDFILDSVLQVFASLFASPLFDGRVVDLEVRAVDDEHTGNIMDDDKKLFHGVRLLASSDHVFARFATGDHHTLSLSNKKLKKLAKEYYDRNFHPKNMTLVLKGPQTILQLRKLVIKEFMCLGEGLTANFAPKQKYRLDTPVFQDIDPNLLVVRSAMPARIRVMFPVYLVKHMDNYGPTVRTLCNLLGEESQLSLSSLLNRERRWVTSVFVHTQKLFGDVEVLVIDMTPTYLAWLHIGEITDEIISYATVNIGESKENDLKELIIHSEKISEYNHKCLTHFESLLDEVLHYAERLNFSKDPDLRSDVAVFETWEDMWKAPQNIRSMVRACFSRAKVKLQVVIPEDMPFDQIATGDVKHDRPYDFDYVLTDVKFERASQTLFSNKTLPSPSMTLTELMNPELEQSVRPPNHLKVRDLTAPTQKPKLISYDRSHEYWQVPDISNEPANTVAATFMVKYPTVMVTPTTIVVLDLLTELVGEELRSELYEYEKIGCFWGLFANVNRTTSIMVSVSGPLFSIQQMVERIFQEIRNQLEVILKIRYDVLKRARVALRKKYEDQLCAHNIKKVLSLSYLVLENELITPTEKLESLEILNEVIMDRIAAQLLHAREYRSILVSGDLGEDLTVWEPMISDEKAQYTPDCPESSSTLLQSGCFYSFSSPESSEDNMSIVMHYTQIGLRSETQLYVMACLYRQLLSSSAVDDLRIKRQLSYSVFSGIRLFQQTFGLYLMVPSGWHDCEYLTDQIEEFLQVIEEMVFLWTEEEFQAELVEPLIESFGSENMDEAGSGLFAALQPLRGSGRKPTTTKFYEHWNQLGQILSGTYDFDTKNCEENCDISILRNVTRLDFLTFIQTNMSARSGVRSVLVITSLPAGGMELQKRKIVSEMIIQKLQSLGLEVTESQVLEALKKCRDTEKYSDVFSHIQLATSKRQKLTLRKLQMLSKVGGVFSSVAGFSFAAKKSDTKIGCALIKKLVYDYRQIQRENETVAAKSSAEKFAELIGIEELQSDISDVETL